VNEVSFTYQIYCFNVYVVTIYYNFSLKMVSLKHIKNGCAVLRKESVDVNSGFIRHIVAQIR